MKLVYVHDKYGSVLEGTFTDGRFSTLRLKLYINEEYENKDENWIAQVLVQYFEDFLDPTPEELTMFALEFGEETTEAYLKFLKSGEKQ